MLMVMSMIHLAVFFTIIQNGEVSTSRFDSVSSISRFIQEFHYTYSGGQWTDDVNNDTAFVDLALMENLDRSQNNSLVKCSASRKSPSLSVELIEQSERLVSLLTRNPNVTDKNQKADCVLVLFYSRTCSFSCRVAPHYNALARAFPSIKLTAVDAILLPRFNSLYGISGVPTIILFHNGRAIGKFNESECTLMKFVLYIVRFTDTMPEERMFVSSMDFGGPVPTRLVQEDDYFLILCWIVVVINIIALLLRAWRALSDSLNRAWIVASDARLNSLD